MNKQEALARCDHWATFYTEKLGFDSPLPIRITFSNRMTRTAGTASFYGKVVQLSTHFMRHEGESFDKTIAHELAHIYADAYHGGRQKHNANWRRVFALSGYRPDRCHQYESSVRKTRASTQFITCNGCNMNLKVGRTVAMKIKSGQARRCGRCSNPITEDMLR